MHCDVSACVCNVCAIDAAASAAPCMDSCGTALTGLTLTQAPGAASCLYMSAMLLLAVGYVDAPSAAYPFLDRGDHTAQHEGGAGEARETEAVLCGEWNEQRVVQYLGLMGRRINVVFWT
jgi:hypothetical protein